MGGRGVLTEQAFTNGAKVSIPCHDLPGDLGRRRAARRDGPLPGCAPPHQADINRLNVYPVPDGDTGTNMALTLEAVVAELDGVPAGSALSEVCRAIGHGSLMGARGNSGRDPLPAPPGHVRADGRAGEAGVDGAVLADALAHASDLARRAVVRPVEGTILTVASAAAEGAAAGAGRGGATLVGVVEEAHSTAADALARTPEMLAVLAQAGVVDAGGTGFLLLLDACWSDRRRGAPPARALGRVRSGPRTTGRGPGAGERRGGERRAAVRSTGPKRGPTTWAISATRSCTSSTPRTTPWRTSKRCGPASATPSSWWAGDGLWNCHIHTDDIGAAIEAGVDAGRPQRIRVTDLAEQVEEERWVREAASAPEARARRRNRWGRRPRRAWWRSSPGTGSAASSARSASTTRSSGASR